MATDAGIAHMAELLTCLNEMAAPIEAGGNVLDLENDNDSVELRNAWQAIEANVGRAKAAVTDLLATRSAPPAPAPAVPVRTPLDAGD